MTSPADTTLGKRTTRAQRPRHWLVVVCVASKPVLPPRSLDLEADGTELGRATGPEALGLSADPRVSRKHARIDRDDEGALSITKLGTAPVEVNGIAVETSPLRDGDVIGMGESLLVVRGVLPERAAPATEGLVGESLAMVALRRAITRVAKTPVTVLLLGESGTGKEVVARTLHRLSGRTGDFVAVNCAAIPETLAEAQLFGHVAGAFTGAQKASAGLFRAADKGTLFLDELGDLPKELQPKLLRALEERTIVPLGSTTAVPIDVRVVTATHRDLMSAVEAGTFRGDLYARVAEFVLHLPPLRSRPEDVLLLLDHLYRQLHGAPLPALAFDLVRALLHHRWPFNVRELRTIASQLQLAAAEGEDVLGMSAIDARMLTPNRARAIDEADGEPTPAPREGPADPKRSDDKPPSRAELEALLREHRGNVTDLARARGRSRKQVYRWLRTHGLDAERYRDG